MAFAGRQHRRVPAWLRRIARCCGNHHPLSATLVAGAGGPGSEVEPKLGADLDLVDVERGRNRMSAGRNVEPAPVLIEEEDRIEGAVPDFELDQKVLGWIDQGVDAGAAA